MKPPRPRIGLLRRSGLLSLLLGLDGLQGQTVVIKDHVYVAIGKADKDYVQCVEYGALVEAGPVATVIGDPAQVRVLGNRQEVQLTEEPEGERIGDRRLEATGSEEQATDRVEG